jgi:hypothetical protein
LPIKQENGSSNHGEPFFLESLTPTLSKGEEKEKERIKSKMK